MPNTVSNDNAKFKRFLTPLMVFALSFGCSVGWGAFVLPGNTFLSLAGPLGTLIGMAVGAFIILIIGVNYYFLMTKIPNAGGTYSYTQQAFGYDHGYLASWFMVLVYLAIIWANATALPLIFSSLAGNVLKFGYLYTVAGYDVYLGEILLSVFSILLLGGACLHGGKTGAIIQTVFAVVLALGILFAFVLSLAAPAGSSAVRFEPLFSPDHKPLSGIFFIVLLGPWAFAGFESVSHSVEEYKFKVRKTLPIMVVSLAVAALAYGLLTMIGASEVPEGYQDWSAYVKDLGALEGYQSVPVFYAIYRAAGMPGLILIGVTAAAGIITGLVGNMTAAGRMIFAMARDGLLPKPMAKLNRNSAPRNAILFLMLLSLPIPFFGRSALGWVIDTNTIGVTIAYAYTSAAALKFAWKEKHPLVKVTSIAGVLISLFFLLYFMIPTEWSVSTLANESYFMLLVWLLAGFIMYYLVFRWDKKQRVGRSVVAWSVMLVLIFSISFIWIRQSARSMSAAASKEIASGLLDQAAVEEKVASVASGVVANTAFQFFVVLISLSIIFVIYLIVQKRHQTAVADKNIAENSSAAKTTFLSNMSHDIRTPMNSIIGYVTLAKREKELTPRVRDYLDKIETSSDHLLALINDVLEMSRIESGRMELMPVPTDLGRVMDEVKNLFATQMATKGLTYEVLLENVTDTAVKLDANRFNRVLLNLISNAYKFTPKGGSVTVKLTETGKEDGRASYVLRVKDTGIGMSKEFAAKVFEAYERERTATVESIQGTGLGTAITKSIVDLMGGAIEVETEKGKGTEFIVTFDLETDESNAGRSDAADASNDEETFRGLKLLLVEDDPDNLKVARMLMEDAGFTVDTAVNGEEAVEMVASSRKDEYAAVIMDIEMPVKNGYDAAKLIRSLKNQSLADIPIVALTAKAFSEDIAAARAAGMNAHIAKPLSMERLKKTMAEVLRK